jgi:hypothetical protein
VKTRGPINPRYLSYTPHLVTYLDILGFRDLIKKKEDNPNFISRMIRRVIETTRPDKLTKEENEENYVNFSDLIVHTVPIFSNSNTTFPTGLVYSEILGLAHAQAELICEELLIRGAVTIGKIEHSYNVIFGPGLISAYDLEQKYRFPRIVLGDPLLREIKTNRLLRFHDTYEDEMKYISTFVREDDDGVMFIDYLGGMQGEFRKPEGYLEFLSTHRKFVLKGLAEFGGTPVFPKYRWLRKYHNRVVRRRLKRTLRRKYCI